MPSFFRLKSAYWAGIFLSIIATLQSCKVKDYVSNARPINHDIWDQLTRENVSPEGYVDYIGFKADSNLFSTYLDLLSKNHPNNKYWNRDQQLAFWINAYNAYTVKLIIDHYPVESIKDIKNGIPFVNTVWDIKFIQIEGRTYDLNNIEHGIIRQNFDDPRIHFAVNCASVSCPKLRNEAYVAERLDEQLNEQARHFLADPGKNKIHEQEVKLSKIFSWYAADFKSSSGDILDFLQSYTDVDISENAKVAYIDYNWKLNTRENMVSE